MSPQERLDVHYYESETPTLSQPILADTDHTPATPIDTMALPAELFSVIGEHLIGDLCFGTLSNLNLTCRAIHDETLPVLFDTIILQWTNTLCDEVSGKSVCRGWIYVKYVIIQNALSEGHGRNTISMFGNTHVMPAAFPRIRLAILHRKQAFQNHLYHFRPCHAIVYDRIAFSTFVSVFLSSTIARHHYCDTTNKLLDFGQFAESDRQSRSYVPDKIMQLTLESGGRVLSNRQAMRKHSDAAWASLLWHACLTLSLPDTAREEDTFLQDLVHVVEWMFFPQAMVRPSSDSPNILVDTQASLSGLPFLMAACGSLGIYRTWNVNIMESILEVHTLVPFLRQGWTSYSATRARYRSSHPNEVPRINLDYPTTLSKFPEIHRWADSDHRMSIDFPLMGPSNGLDHLITTIGRTNP